MRIALLADIHGNKLALDAVVADMARRHIDAVVNLGDCVSGPLWPTETLALLRQSHWPTVCGNHDRWVGEGSPETLGASDRYAWDSLASDDRRWLRDLPPGLDLFGYIAAMHACPGDDNAYLLEDQSAFGLIRAPAERIAARLAGIRAPIVLTAHSHQPGLVKLPDGPWIINPGSVGCPAYDDDSTTPPHISEAGSPAARYAILERLDSVMVEFLSIPYDHEAAAARALANGRPDWAFALRTGYAAALFEPRS